MFAMVHARNVFLALGLATHCECSHFRANIPCAENWADFLWFEPEDPSYRMIFSEYHDVSDGVASVFMTHSQGTYGTGYYAITRNPEGNLLLSGARSQILSKDFSVMNFSNEKFWSWPCICTCSNGVPVNVTDCAEAAWESAELPQHYQERCASCDAFFHLDDVSCVENVCGCVDGTAVANSECVEHDTVQCASCDQNFHLSLDHECLPNVCFCDNGIAVPSSDCNAHESNQCQSCDDSFHLDPDFACRDKICECGNGTAVPSSECDSHEAQDCQSCDPYFHLDDSACVENICRCQNGTVAEVGKCEVHDAEQCDSCDEFFHLDDSHVCTTNKCRCPNGTPVENSECRLHDGVQCTACDKCYSLDDSGRCERFSFTDAASFRSLAAIQGLVFVFLAVSVWV